MARHYFGGLWNLAIHVLNRLSALEQEQRKIMSEVTDLQDAVAAITAAVGNAVAEIQVLASEISGQTTNPAAMEAAAGSLNALATNLQSAVTAAMSPPPPPPTPAP